MAESAHKKPVQRGLASLREKYAAMFAAHAEGGQSQAGPHWQRVMEAAEPRERELWDELRRRIEASGGAARIVRNGDGWDLAADAAWKRANREAWMDLQALVWGPAALDLKKVMEDE